MESKILKQKYVAIVTRQHGIVQKIFKIKKKMRVTLRRSQDPIDVFF